MQLVCFRTLSNQGAASAPKAFYKLICLKIAQADLSPSAYFHVTAGLGLASERDAFLQECVQRAHSSGAAVLLFALNLLVPRFDDEGTGMLQDSVLARALQLCH